jgi:hypothetical protein
MSAAPIAESVVAVRKHGVGLQYEIKWQGQAETTWKAASIVKRQHPVLVQAFELQQQQQRQPPQQQEGVADQAGTAEAAPMELEAASDVSAMREQVEALQQIVRQQGQQLQQLRASPSQSPQASPRQQALQQPPAPAATAAAPAASRRKEPRLTDLAEYNGASGDKLDAWLAELRRCARYYQLSGSEAVEFAAARLRDAADTWWTQMDASQQTSIISVETLSAALLARFQPVTTARKAREKLHSLQQGARHIDEYIAEFTRLHAQVPDMAEPDARAQFVRGLRRELAVKLEDVDWEAMPLSEVLARAARIGARTAATMAAPSASSGRASVNQMDVDDGEGTSLDDRIQRAVLNAMQAQGGGAAGLGAKTQTQRGYQNEHSSRGGGRGGRIVSRGGRTGAGGEFRGTVPGVPANVAQQRWAAGQCLRCGSNEHRGHGCPNATSATPSSF